MKNWENTAGRVLKNPPSMSCTSLYTLTLHQSRPEVTTSGPQPTCGPLSPPAAACQCFRDFPLQLAWVWHRLFTYLILTQRMLELQTNTSSVKIVNFVQLTLVCLNPSYPTAACHFCTSDSWPCCLLKLCTPALHCVQKNLLTFCSLSSRIMHSFVNKIAGNRPTYEKW